MMSWLPITVFALLVATIDFEQKTAIAFIISGCCSTRYSWTILSLSSAWSSPETLNDTLLSSAVLVSTSPSLSINNNHIRIHHTALKTSNITIAIQFYSLLGFNPVAKFRAGPARAAWLSFTNTTHATSQLQPILELIEVPAHMIPASSNTNTSTTTPPRAPNLIKYPTILGYNHVALDVTTQIRQHNTSNTDTNSTQQTATLQDWLNSLNEKSMQQYKKTIRVVVEPRKQIIGPYVYELAFLMDADGCLIELIHQIGNRANIVSSSNWTQSSNMEYGWEPWDGTGWK